MNRWAVLVSVAAFALCVNHLASRSSQPIVVHLSSSSSSHLRARSPGDKADAAADAKAEEGAVDADADAATAQPATTAAEAGEASAGGAFCTHIDDLFPGKVGGPASRQVWVPDSGCRLEVYNDTTSCFNKRTVVLLGDSLLRDTAMKVAGLGSRMEQVPPGFKQCVDAGQPNVRAAFCNERSRRYVAPGGGELLMAWSPSARSEGALRDPYTVRLLRNADVVVMGGQQWDMGAHYRGIDYYLKQMKQRVRAVKKMMKKPGAELLVSGAHWYQEKDCRRGERCSLCNSPRKSAAYREAALLAAACVPGVKVYDVFRLTRDVGPGHTKDGFHVHPEFMMEVDVLLNRVCRPEDSRLEFAASDLRCSDEAELLAKWKSAPEVLHGCLRP